MKFSYLTLGENRWPGFERDDTQYYGDYLRLARELDKLDYMTLWTGEHHFAHVAAVSSPTVLLSAIAAQTERIRLATAVNVLPFHHPVRYAEDLATLDVISGGRAQVGAGVGYAKGEFDGFEIPMEEARRRMHEVLTIARSALDTGHFGVSGEFFNTLEHLKLVPAPIQQPFPTYVALSGSWDTVLWAAKNNHNLITGSQSPATTNKSLPKTIDVFQSTRQDAGHGVGKVAVPFFTLCSNDEDKIEQEFQRMVDYWHHLSNDLDVELPPHLAYWANLKKTFAGLTVAQLHNRQTAFGKPEKLIELFLNVAASGVDEICIESFYGPQDVDEAIENARFLREEVMPFVDERFGGPKYGWDPDQRKIVLLKEATNKYPGIETPEPPEVEVDENVDAARIGV